MAGDMRVGHYILEGRACIESTGRLIEEENLGIVESLDSDTQATTLSA